MKLIENNIGIYKIINLVADKRTGICKVYIGSSCNIKIRKRDHFNLLNNNKHKNNHLQSAVNKDGIENFKFEIIKYIIKIEDKKLLKEMILKEEQKEINNYKNIDGSIDHHKCYNLVTIAGSRLGSSCSEETKEKIRKSTQGKNLGRKHTQETINKMKVNCTRKKNYWGHKQSEETKNKRARKLMKKVINLTTGKIFNSIKEAAEFYSADTSKITKVCKGERKLTCGHIWSYYKEIV